MDKGTVIERALSKIGDREFVERTATEDPVRRAYDFILRKANALHRWTFARVVGREVEVKERMKAKIEDDKYCYGNKIVTWERAWERWDIGAYIEIPTECMRLEKVQDQFGRKVRHSEFGVRTGAGVRVAHVDGCAAGTVLYLTYIADLIALEVDPPDNNPWFCEGVICSLASDLAMTIINNAEMSRVYAEEAERAFQRAIDIDVRQWQSNDQHPLKDILDQDVLNIKTRRYFR